MNLYLVRHGVAFDHGDPAYPNDDDRPLTEKGRKQFRKAAQGLLELADAPALILTSPLPRAAQTAAILQAESGDASRTLTCEAMQPGGAFEQVMKDCEQHAATLSALEAERGIALVGHNPSIGMLAAWLLNGDSACFSVALDKGGAAALAFDGLPGPGRGELLWLATQKMLRALA